MRNTLIIIAILSSSVLQAQHLSPQVIGSAGGSFNTANTTMDMTVGEVAIETYTNNTILTQGFQQGNLKVETVVIEIEEEIKIYPNPTTSIIIIEVERVGDAELVLIDALGKTVLKGEMKNQQKKELDLRQLAEGNYFLQLIKDGKKSVYQINKSK